MANILGVRDSNTILQARRVVDMSKQIAYLDPEIGPFITILKRLKGSGVRVAKSNKIEWLENDILASYTTADGEHAAGLTEINVVDGSIFRAGDIIKVPSTNETIFVISVSNNALTVERSYGTAAADTIATGATLLRIGNANKENADIRDAITTQEASKYNLTQIFRTPIELSNTEIASELYGGSDLAQQRRDALMVHKKEIALAAYFGERYADTGSNGKRNTMGGLYEYISGGSNTQAFASSGVTFTYKNFCQYVAKEVFKHGSRNKLMLVGGTTQAGIDAWGIDDLMTTVKDDTYGITVSKLRTSFGSLNVVYDPLLDIDEIYSGYGFIVDLAKVNYAYLKGRDTQLLTNRQGNGVDGVKDEYLTECSLEVQNPDAHMVFTGAYVA